MVRNIYLLTVFFPYVSPVLLFGDLQPINIAMACIYFFFTFRINADVIETILYTIALFVLIIGLLDLFLGGSIYSVIRGCSAYISFILNFINLRRIYFHNKHTIEKWVLWSLAIYIIVAITQIFFGHWTEIFVNQRTFVTGGRGVSSLTAEPTFFGFVVILLFLSSSKNIKFLLVSLGLILSRSASAIFSILFIYSLNLRKIFQLLLIMILFFIIGLILIDQILIWRPAIIFQKILNNGLYNLILYDHSINDRLGSLVVGIYGSFSSYLVPQGFSSWPSYILNLNDQIIFYFPNISIGHGRIHSSLGAILFELGIVGLAFFIFILFLIKRPIMKFAFIILASQSVPWSLPIFALFVAVSSSFQTTTK